MQRAMCKMLKYLISTSIMKNAIVKYNLQEGLVNGVVLENTDDISKFNKHFESFENRLITKWVTSNEPPSRYNHVFTGLSPLEHVLAALAITYARTDQLSNNPIYHVGSARIRIVTGMITLLNKYGSLFVNNGGGYIAVSMLESVELSEFTEFYKPATHVIRDGSYVINLENDSKLEDIAVQYMTTTWCQGHWLSAPNRTYSYVTDLRLYDRKRLTGVFKQFVKQGGKLVYVYTTGQDVDQMYMYVACAKDAGIKEFAFDFNAGVTDDIAEFVEHIKSFATVTIIDKSTV